LISSLLDPRLDDYGSNLKWS